MLHCDFVNGTKPVLLVGVDVIIFDIGLFHSLWGIESCVAQHLDGGYGRFTWCICHILALLISLPFAFVSRPRPCALWPLLIQVGSLTKSFFPSTFSLLTYNIRTKSFHFILPHCSSFLRIFYFFFKAKCLRNWSAHIKFVSTSTYSTDIYWLSKCCLAICFSCLYFWYCNEFLPGINLYLSSSACYL